MTLYVHITDDCRKEAQDLSLEPRLIKIKEQIETGQNLSGFDFLSATVLKRKIGRPFRLIAWQHAIANDELIIFVRLLKRRLADYTRQLDAIKDNPKPYSDDKIKQIYSELTTIAPVPSRPVPSAEERAWLDEVLQEKSPTNDTFVFETRSWVTKMRMNQLAPLYHKVLEDMADTTRLTVAAPHNHWLDDIGIAYHYRSDLDCLLLLEPLQSGQSADIHEYESRLSRANDRTDMARLAARSYPLLVVLDRDAWLAIQTDEESNLALSPEEAQLIEAVHTTGAGTNIAYPLFINGHAGSGKSTILQYLASAYVDFALRTDTHRFPIYLTASDDLLTRARQIVKGLLTTNYERVIEDKIDSNAIDRLLDKSFQTFHQLLYSLLSSDRKASLRNDRYVNYASFRRLWHRKFATHREARQLSVEVSWHVIRSLIKGIRSDWDDELAPEDFRDLPRRRRSVSSDEYEKVYDLVWSKWYKPLCEHEGYWDDQDLAAYVLGADAASSDDYAAIFCDEAQDFTSVELDVIFQLSLYSRRTLQPHELRQVPMIFAGDPLQTINPTGFRWDAVKADFHDRFRATIESRTKSSIDMSYRVLHLNYRSNAGIVRFCNLIQIARATLLDRTDIRPQGYWWMEDSVSPTWFMIEDPITERYLRDHPEFVKLVDCHEGEESEYVKRDPTLRDALDQSEGTYSNVMCPTRAKGLEFSAVVLYRFGERVTRDFDRLLHRQVDLKDPQSRLQWEYFFSRLYVAASRARDRLIIVDSKEGIEHFWKFAIDPEGHDGLLDTALQSSIWSGQWAPLSRGGPEAWDKGRQIDERVQAEQYAAQGKRDADPYLLKQAASSFRRVNDDYRARECIAQAAEVDEDWKVAGDRYCDLHLDEDAFHCYWKGKLWGALKRLTSRESYVGRLESRAADFMASGDVPPPRRFLCQLITAANDESRLQEIASDHTWQSVLARAADRIARAADNITIPWSDLFETFERLAREGVRLSRSSRATIAYRSKNFEKAVRLWQADKQVQSTEYKRSMAWITPFPSCLELFKQLGDHAEILRQWGKNHPSDAMIRTLPRSIVYTVADAALDQGELAITAMIMQAHPHPDRVGKLLSAAVKARDDAIVYEGVVIAIRLFVQTKAWNDVVDAESLSSISKLARIPVVDIRAALNRTGKSNVVLKTMVWELASSKALADSAPKVVSIFLQRRFISRDGTQGTGMIGSDIPERVVGAAIERSGRIVDALQYYEDLLQRDKESYDIRRFAAERLVRNLERHALEKVENQQQARKQSDRAEQLRKNWNINDSDLDDYPTVRTPKEDKAGNATPDEMDYSFWGSPDLDALLRSQNVEQLSDIRELYGTWPGDESDDFEAEIDALRHSDYGHEDP